VGVTRRSCGSERIAKSPLGERGACEAGSGDAFGAEGEVAGSGDAFGAKRSKALQIHVWIGAPVVCSTAARLAYLPSFSFCFLTSSSRRMRRRILPTIVLGSSLRNSTARGTLYLASRSLQKAIISSALAVSPSFKIM